MRKFITYYLSLQFYLVFLLYTLLYIPAITIILFPFAICKPARYRYRRIRRAISWYGKGVSWIPFPFIRLIYEDHSEHDIREPYIYVCNHRAASDAFLLCVLPDEAVQVVNIWPFRIPLLGFFARMAGYLNIRMMSSEDFFEKASTLLEENVSIIFFPEGTRSASREMGHFHGSAFRLALKSRVPIVPICISGSENIPPKGSLLLRPGIIRVRRLPAVTWDEFKDMNVYSLKNRVRAMMYDELVMMETGA